VPKKSTKPKTKKPAKPTKNSTDIDLATHNKHLAILGLPPVKTPLVEGPPTSPTPRAKKGSALAMLDSFYEGEGPTSPRGRFIHWWGQFSGALPAPFTLKQGGHGYLEARDVEHATQLFAKLRNAVLKMKPKASDLDEDDQEDAEAAKEYKLKATREWAGISDKGLVWYRWMLIDGRQMTVELKHDITKRELSGDKLIKAK
jgi:hypothetical protein